ncbi:MAG: class I SAM-dependent methyltransferase [Thermoanaerobaculia bacterium]
MKEKPNWGKGEEFLGPRHLARLRKIISFLPKERCIVLDAAVGLGVLSEKLSKIGFLPIGIDLDPGAVFHSKKKGIRTILGSLENLPFKDETFPLIISSETLEHLEDYKKGISEFYRIIKKGGVLIVSVPLNQKFWSYWDEWAGHKRRFSPDSLKDDFEPFKIKKAIFFGFPFMLLYDLIFLRRFIKKRGEGKIDDKGLFKNFFIFLFSLNIPVKNFSPNLIIKLEKS